MTKRLLMFTISSILFIGSTFSLEIPKAKAPNQELLRLLLSTFLGANDLQNAFEVAKKGAEIYSNDPYWWEWYGKLASWLGKTEEAMEANLKLIELRPVREGIVETFKLALSTNRYDFAVNLIRKHPWLIEDLKPEEIYFIFFNAGRIEEFIKLAEELYRKEKKDEYLYYIALAQVRYGKYKQAREYMEKLEAIRPLKLEEVILYSDIILSERKQKQAYELLKRYFGKIESDKEELYILYLRRLSELAWINQDIETSAKASEMLHKMGKASKDDYIRLYTYYSLKKNYTKAIEYASIGYRKSRNEYLFTLWVEGLSALADWKGIVDAYREYDREKFLANSYLTAIYTRAVYMLGRRQEARQIILHSLKANPSLSLLSNAIYIAVGFHDRELIDYLIRNFSSEERMLPKEFALLYMSKQDGYKAKRLLDQIKEKDKEELLLYSYALNLMGRTEEANMIRYTLVRDVLKDGKVREDPDELRIPLMSGVGILPSYYMQDLLAKAREELRPEIWLNIYLSHLFVNNFYEEIEYLKNIKKAKLEPWMELNLALRNNDRERINQLLEEMADILPYRDVVESYRRLGQYGKAVEHAQQSLEKNPEDVLVYEQLRQLVDSYVSQIRIGVSQRNVDKTGYLLYNLHLMYALTDKWYILLNREGGFFMYNSNPALANLPSSFVYNSVALRINVNNGYYEIGTVLGKGIKDFAGIEAKASKRLHTVDNITTSVYYNKPANETLIMSLSAVKDGVSINASKSLSPRIGLSSTFEYNRFKSQDMKEIGQGFNLYLETFYKLRVAYPDYTFRFYTAFADYEEKNNKSNRLLRLYSFENPRVLPADSFTVGIGLRFGLDRKEMLSRSLSPFLDSEVFYNTFNGLGYGLSVGLGGRLIGKDTLFLGVRRSSNYGNTKATYWEPFLQYRLLLPSD